jgi:predicted alpha/beta-fold hydrolase
MNEFRAPRWLTNAHAQTIYSALLAPRPRLRWVRTRWDTHDGDFIDLDWVTDASPATGHQPTQPLLALFHGLEGGSASHYAHTILGCAARRGYRGVVVHFRGCSGMPNRLPRAYHSGDTEELDWVLRRLRASINDGILNVVGISLGGNVLLKWLGERGDAARTVVNAACAVSAPMDLVATGTALDQGVNRMYAWNFLRSLRKKSLAKLVRHPQLFDPAATRRARTLRAFDDVVTAPLHGFKDALDYWTRASSKPLLKHIRVPTLILNARDDPFMPASALPAGDDVSADVSLMFPHHGGHVGFVTGRFPGSLEWMPTQVVNFLTARSLDAGSRNQRVA